MGGLLGIMDFRSLGLLDFLEAGKRAQTRRFGFTGAAARRGQQRENGSDECGKNANHGDGCGRLSGVVGWCGGLLPVKGNPKAGVNIISWA